MISLPRLSGLTCCLVCCVASFTHTIRAAEVFVADQTSDSILSFDETTGKFLRVVTATGLDDPTGLTFGPGGYLYVSNLQSSSAASVVKVDPITGETTPFITEVDGPGGIAYHQASNTLFVSQFAASPQGFSDGSEVFRYDGEANLLQTLGTGSAATGRSGMTFDDAGNLYVSEANFFGAASTVLKYEAPIGDPFDDYATTATTFASGAEVDIAFPAPVSGFNGLAFDDNGNLFVASLVGQALVKFFVAEGEVVEGIPFGAPIAYPSGVMIGEDGNILVSNMGNDNPTDPIYGSTVFPGSISRFNADKFGAAPFLLGDANRDTMVDHADLAAWQGTYATAYDPMANADLDGDFDTDGRDFLLWQRGFGNAGYAGGFRPAGMVRYEPAIAIFSVPEPGSVCLALLALAGGPWLRQRSMR
jgi:DNA-binding beta-propeller fold protein YncE